MSLKLLRHFLTLTILSLLLSFLMAKSYAQQLDSEQIKSAYIYNFIKHVTWPDENQKNDYILGIYQDTTFYNLIAKSLNNKPIKNKKLSVVLIDNLQQAVNTDTLFISAKSTLDITIIASSLRQSNTLLITDNSLDKHNTMINLVFNPESQAITFEVNKSNIIYENLTVSPELLLLGGTEVDVATLYRETEVAMQKMRQREVSLQLALDKQDKQLNATTVKLININSELKNREKIAEQRQIELVFLKKGIDRQKNSIIVKEEQLKDVINQLSTARNNLEDKQLAAENKELENKAMAKRIIYNKNILEQQQSQIDLHALQLIKKNEQLAQGKERIDQQSFYITLLAGLIATAVLVSVLIVWLFIKNKRTTRTLSQTLTNLKSMQDQLIQSEKLASLGKLTAGVAHEINTPLGIAVTSTSSALEETESLKESFEKNSITRTAMSKYFNSMVLSAELNMSSLNRVIELLNNFKQVAADQVVGEVREINCNDYINEVMQTLSAELKRFRVNYEYKGVEDLCITTIPGAIAQVLTNLVTNSLKHGFENKNSGNICINTAIKDDSVLIVYEDDGVGMNEEVLQNIFEPFFTTKRNSGGTGLGMNIVYNIINQKLLGSIQIRSSPDHGARFIITLPKTIAD
jgi:signal transduction histidine kinase